MGSVSHQDALQGILNGIPDPILIVNHHMHIVFANDAAVELCGVSLVGQLVVVAFRHPNAVDCLNEAARSRQTQEARVTLSESGTDTQFRFLVSPITSLDSQALKLVITLRDAGQSDGVEQMRRSFVANVSHELRSPLSVLMTCAETLRNTPIEDRKAMRTFLDIFSEETQRMNRLVNDLLSLSKVEANERVRPTAPIKLTDILPAVLHTMQALADEFGSELHLTIDADDCELVVAGDAEQLRQVFINLIENALKYGHPASRVMVTCRADAGMKGNCTQFVVVEVSDEGDGIHAAHLPRLTERFYRVDDHRSRAVGGTGLGLAIVKHIVHRHRGWLSVMSNLGKGSVFRVNLPSFPFQDEAPHQNQ